MQGYSRQDDHEKAAQSIDQAIKLEPGQSKYYRLGCEIAKAVKEPLSTGSFSIDGLGST